MHPARHNECKNKPHYFEMFLAETKKPCPGQPAKPPETDWSEPTRCRHLGDELKNESWTCTGCGGKEVEFQVRECAIFGICSERPRSDVVDACQGCEAYEPTPPVTPSPEMPQVDNPPKWAVGITTAPRSKHRTILECVESVIANGWSPILFAEPGTDLSGLPDGLEIVQRTERLGVWRNWKSAAEELLRRVPEADWILTIQDDTVFHPQAKWFAESFWQTRADRIYSFYTPAHYGQRADVFDGTGKMRKHNLPYESARKWVNKPRIRQGWKMKSYDRPIGTHRIHTHSLWGACALAFPRDVLRKLLNHKIARTWLGARGKMKPDAWRKRQTSEPWRIQNSDTAIGKIMNVLGYEFYCPVPSLADHVADASADGVNHGGRGGRRSAAWFAVGDLREVFSEETIGAAS